MMNINEKLLESIFNEDLEQVKECLAQGANVNYDNGKSYEPPIILVSINGNLEIAKLLIQHGADVNNKSYFGSERQYYTTALNQSAHKGHLEHLEIAKLLIQHGADVNAKDSDGWNPLIAAVNRGYMNDPNKQSLEFAKLLIENGADVNAKNIYGNTALMIATQNNSNTKYLDTIKLLIENGADVNAKNNKNETALKIAQKLNKKLNNKEIILLKAQELLEKAIYKSKQKTKSKQKSNDFEMGM